jgi:hypothetical protein
VHGALGDVGYRVRECRTYVVKMTPFGGLQDDLTWRFCFSLFAIENGWMESRAISKVERLKNAFLVF